jgi:alpha-tubulin suppressor-like RCC1 family protein
VATAPCAPEFSLVPDLVDVERLVVRRHTTCAVTVLGGVTCFGDASPLPGSLSAPLAPTEIDPLRGREFALGWDHGCLLGASGEPACWGDHRRGQLGVGEVPAGCGADRCDDPVPLIDEGEALAVAAGDGFTCLRVDGGVRCFGMAAEGQLGISTPDDLDACATGPCSKTPRDVRFEGISELPDGIVVGDRHACALMADGTAACWGNNERAQIARHLDDEDDAVTLPSGLYGL